MIKNIIIIVLIYICGSLIYANRANVDVILDDLVSKKEAVKKGAVYLKDKIEYNMSDDLLNLDSKSSEEFTYSEGLMTGNVEEETFTEEK
tara:strand:- start:6207 stop:6476 length:270 start_codon:yes stop_codon:yes gene_type:complete